MARATADPEPLCLGALLVPPIPPRLFSMGDLAILRRPAVGLMCSTTCPGGLALRARDLAPEVAGHGPAVVSGFHSPVEASWLPVLLRGVHPVVWCMARHLDPGRLDPACQDAVAAGRLLLLSVFGPWARFSNRRRAWIRNLLVARLTRHLLVVYAHPGGSVERCACEAREWGRQILTFDVPENRALLALGAQALTPCFDQGTRSVYGMRRMRSLARQIRSVSPPAQ